MDNKKYLIVVFLILFGLFGLAFLIQNDDKNSISMYLYSEEELDIYEEYITKNFGPIDKILHEEVSPDIHLDIIVIKPTEEDNYYKLITMGMGAYKMNVPKSLENNQLDHAELVLYLPPSWDIESEHEENYWPIRALKNLARIPINNKTWLGYGHTISNDSENTPYAYSTDFCSMLLLNALNTDLEELNLILEDRGKINFYQLFPLYEEELEYKFEYGIDALFNLFSSKDSFPIVNIFRKNYCR